MASAIAMIAHCLYHQTPILDRAYCPDCGEALHVIRSVWYCPRCLSRRDVNACPICTGQSWN